MSSSHTCLRVRDIDASLRFYEALRFERRGLLQFDAAPDVYLGLPGDGDTLELTVDAAARTVLARGRLRPLRRHGPGSRRATRPAGFHRGRAREAAVPPRRARGLRIYFVADSDGSRVELIDGDAFPTPQTPSPADRDQARGASRHSPFGAARIRSHRSGRLAYARVAATRTRRPAWAPASSRVGDNVVVSIAVAAAATPLTCAISAAARAACGRRGARDG